jgi:hypothetical protein
MPEETNQANAQGGSNKWVYILIGIVAVLVVLGLFAQMSGYMMMRAAGVNVVPNMDGSATYTATDGEGGSVTVGGNSMPENWPSDAPANFAGAQIQYSGTSNPQTGSAGAAVVYTAQASASAIVEHYKQAFAAQGWTIENTANMGAASVMSAKKDERTFGVSIVDAGDGSVQVSVGTDL